MDYSRSMSGNCPFVTNIMVYKAGSVLDEGAIVCVTGNTASLQGAAISVATTTAANDNVIGVTQSDTSFLAANPENLSRYATAFNIGSDGFPDTTTATGGTGQNFAPCVVNTDALFYATYSTTTGTTSTGDSKTVGITASTGTSVVLGSSGVDHCGGWLYSAAVTNTAGNTPTFSGSIRWVGATAASDTYGLNTAMNVSTDGVMLIVSQPLRNLTVINSGGNALRSHGAGTAGKINQGLFILDNYMVSDDHPLTPLREHVHDGLDGLTNTILYSEIACTQNAWNNL